MMNETLSKDWKAIDQLLAQTVTEASRLLKSLDTRPAGVNVKADVAVNADVNVSSEQHDETPPNQTPMLSSLPNVGHGASSVMQQLMERYEPGFSASAGPRYWAFVTGGSTPAALMGDWIASAIDQNAADPASSAAVLELEGLAMLRQLFGLSDHRHEGSFVTGATMSNFVGLAIGRQWVGHQLNTPVNIAQEGLASVPAPIKVLSAVPHSSIYKACSMLGLGRNAVVKIRTLPDREAMDLAALEEALIEMGAATDQQGQAQPCIVCANAGTVNSVDFDDIRGIVQLRTKYSFWLHVDAAFGGFAACSPKYAHLVDGWDDADSICIDCHKWLNVPYDSAIQLTRHTDLQIETFCNASAPYLGGTETGFVHRTPENSRRFRALPAWCTLMAYGRDGYQNIVERNCYMAQQIGDWIDSRAEFDLLSPVILNGVLFTLPGRPGMDAVRAYLDRLRDGGQLYLTPTVHFDVAAVRISVVNWRSDVADIAVAQQALLDALIE
jgi:glutamate/tyrosine decarboxylase-like PLP-dependent enzyme